MPDTTLPSYQEATRTVDWLELVGPSISIQDYARLCRVSRHFCDYFLPRLWTDPLAICYALEPTTNFGGITMPKIELFLHIVPNTRFSTRSLVLAFCPRIRDWLNLNLYGVVDSATWSPSSSFPNLRCMTLNDGPHNPGSHAGIIQYSPSQFPNNLCVMAARRCFWLPVHWPAPEHLGNVVYYDDSRIHQSYSSTPRFKGMHRLRILRVAGHNMGDSYASKIFQDLNRRLWSLDLSNNWLTENFFVFVAYSGTYLGRGARVGNRRLKDGSCICIARDHGHELEGFLCSSGMGLFVHETPWTEDLRLYHPRRYHEDSPGYVRRQNSEDGTAESPNFRRRIMDDSLDTVVKAICSQRDASLINTLDICQPPLSGITHLYLNQNPMITAESFKMIIELGLEQLQRFECDSMLFMSESDMSQYNQFYPDSQAVPPFVSCCKKQAISCILGLSHLFRPVFSNLQILRIHHSLVTNLPSLTGFYVLSPMEKIWFAETFLLPRADLVFPNPFHPDMNPRLRSLTLTHIPQYSTGPLIERLKGLLKAAWFQEQTIARLRDEYRRVHQSRYQPPLLSGLRKIVLEFDPVPRREKQGTDQAGFEGFDAEALLNSGATKEFGTFGGYTTSSNGNGTSGTSAVRHVNAIDNGSTGSRRQEPQHGSDGGSELDRLATETSGVRAAVQQQSKDQQPLEEEVERPRVHSKRRVKPIYVTSTLPTRQKIKVFVGYRYQDHQDGDGPLNQQPVSVSVSSNSTDGNGVSSGQAPAVQKFFEVLQGQSLNRPEVQVEGLPVPSSSPVSTPDSLPTDEPPAYTALPTCIPGPSASASLPPPTTPTITSSSRSTPTPSRGTLTTSTLPPPSSFSSPITPIPPCFTSHPYFLSLEEQNASLTTYHNLITRVLSSHDLDNLGAAEKNEQRREKVLELIDPVMAATPSMVRVGVPTQSDEGGGTGGGGAGCHVFWQAWKAGLWGDFMLPDSEGDLDKVNNCNDDDKEKGGGDDHGGSDEYGGDGNEHNEGDTETRETSPTTSSRVSGGTSTTTKGAASKRHRDLLRRNMRRPTAQELGQMKNTIEELKKFRALTSGGGGSGSSQDQKSKCKDKDKDKGKQKAVDDDSSAEEDSEWAGKHWMGQLKVIRKTSGTDEGG